MQTQLYGRLLCTAARSVIRSQGGFVVPYVVFCAFCVAYSSVSGSLVAWGSAAAAGSGIPEIKTYLNGVHVPGKPMVCQQHCCCT